MGTWIGVPFQGGSFNLESKAAIATFAFEHLELGRLEFLTRVDNGRSIAAMRKLPGVRDEGVLAERIMADGTAHDARLFVLLASDFDASAWPAVVVDPDE